MRSHHKSIQIWWTGTTSFSCSNRSTGLTRARNDTPTRAARPVEDEGAETETDTFGLDSPTTDYGFPRSIGEPAPFSA